MHSKRICESFQQTFLGFHVQESSDLDLLTTKVRFFLKMCACRRFILPSMYSISLDFPRFPSTSLDFPRFSSIFLDFPRLPSTSLDFPQLSSISLDFPRLLSTSLDFPRFPSISLDFPQFILIFPAPSRNSKIQNFPCRSNLRNFSTELCPPPQKSRRGGSCVAPTISEFYLFNRILSAR
jgi:hypothetical protein